VDEQYYFNATVQYHFTDAFSATLIGSNIFNNEPPQTGEEEYPYYNIFVFDPYGRELFVELTYEYQ
jgi:outer membrane receptor protein involved in Fe transport